ncbi:MAG TPA: chromate transporter [Bryobacteraceae bacterium]|nr:chromate transporter [Bryobacteraceae bacterium]
MRDWSKLGELFATMARHGGLTFGGGGPTIAAVEYETIDRRGWLTREQFRLAFALSRITPGTNLLAFCTAVGWQVGGVSGSVAALIASSLPCSAVTVALTILLEFWQGYRWAAVAIQGAAAAAIGIVAASCWHLIEPHMVAGSRLRTVFLVALAVTLQAFDVSPLRILLLAAIVGAVWREAP